MAEGKLHLHFEIVPTRFLNSHNGSLLPITVTKVTGPDAPFRFLAYVYLCHLNEDIDGAPRAYAPPISATNLSPTNGMLEKSIKNATNQKAPVFDPQGNNTWLWAGVVSRKDGEVPGLVLDKRLFLRDHDQKFPVMHQPGTPDQGFYVSQTKSLAYNPSRPHPPKEWDQDRYLDASAVPYAVYADLWVSLGVDKGDYGLAIRPQNGAHSGFLFGDSGTPNKVGECSRKLVRTLSANGYNEDLVMFFVFPGSGSGDPAQGLIRSRVLFEIAKLNNVPNTYKLGEIYSSKSSKKIMAALAAWGYHNTLIDI